MKPNDPTPKKEEELPIFSLIQQLKDESLDPRTLPSELRQQCVEVLWSEGYNESAMAQILKRSEKTIKRDLQKIREKNALSPDLELARQIIGETVQRARMHQGYLVRLARSKDATVSEKAQSEYLAWRVQKELVEKMQSFGYLPSRPQEITGDIYHHMSLQEEERSFGEIKTMITQIENVARETDTFSNELEREVTLLRAKIEKAEITYEVKNLLENQQQIKEGKETQNET
jgi:DNA-binding CsgD family transcriptional regulator